MANAIDMKSFERRLFFSTVAYQEEYDTKSHKSEGGTHIPIADPRWNQELLVANGYRYKAWSGAGAPLPR
jgi:hypothetical protein